MKQITRSYTSPYTYSESYFSFKDHRIQTCIHAIKYYHRPDLIEPLATHTAPHVQKQIKDKASVVLIPIPTTRLRRWMRGYNQAALLAEAYSRALHIPVRTDILARNEQSVRQVETKNRAERLRNPQGAFTVCREMLPKHTTIILIDDVTTTGATIHEARRTLLESGASAVFAFTLAH